MLQTVEELIEINAPDWRIHQAIRREAAPKIQEIEDRKSQARWNRKLISKGYTPESLPATETPLEPTTIKIADVATKVIANVNRKKTREEIKASYKTTQRMNRIDASAAAKNEVRRNSMSPRKLTDEEQLEADKQKRELHVRLADQLLDCHYTARAGSIIRFPTQLISDVIRTAKRATMSEAGRWGFVSRGHEVGFYKDNTPIELLKKAGLLEYVDSKDQTEMMPLDEFLSLSMIITATDTIAGLAVKHMGEKRPISETSPEDYKNMEIMREWLLEAELNTPKLLTEIEEAELEDYLFDFDLVARVAEDAIDGAINDSKISETELILSLSSSTPKNKKDRWAQTRGIEALGLHAQLVGGAHGKRKCTSSAFKNYLKSREDQEHFQKTHFITDGKISIPFGEAGKTLEKRLAELRAIAKGIQKHEEAQGKEWAAIVCTLESAYHPNPLPSKYNPRPNETHHWNGVLPQEASKVLSKRYESVRKSLEKRGIILTTLRTNETMQDATPHANILVYYPKGKEEIVIKAFKKHFAHNEGAAMKYTLGREEAANGKKASFATYFMKYFTKFLKDDPSFKIEIEAAWRRTHGIRGYGFSGIAPLGQWRLLRSRREAPTGTAKGDLLFDTWKAARNSDFAEFMRLTGGSGIKRRDRKLQTTHEFSTPTDPAALPRKIAVGVIDVATNKELTLKVLGQWRLTALPSKLPTKSLKERLTDFKKEKAAANATAKNQPKTATVALRLPSSSASTAKIGTSPPPKTLITLH